MRIIILDKRKLGMFLIIVGLMLVLLSLEKTFDEKLKYTSLIQNNVKSLKEYIFAEKKVSYKLPSEWKTTQEQFSGGEIIYHNSFTSETGDVHGFVQVWNLRQDLKSFLEKSKEISETENKISDYKLIPINIDGHDGYELIYTISTPNNTYKAYEYFLKQNDFFIRFAFYTRLDSFKENFPTNFETIVKTLDFGN